MQLSALRIQNFRSIVDSGEIRSESMLALVGENNCGKSNVLRALEAFLSAGAGGVRAVHFYDGASPIVITITFAKLTRQDRKVLRRYLLGDRLILEKHVTIERDADSGKGSVKAEYHGYIATPRDWWLSTDAIIAHEGAKPNWTTIAEAHGLGSGISTKTAYSAAIDRYLEDHEVEYDEPTLGDTQALGRQTALLARLPAFYLLPAITDYADEIDRRSTTTVFRRLMSDLALRLLPSDPRYAEIESTLARLRGLMNTDGATGVTRIAIFQRVEKAICAATQRLIPGVTGVEIEVEVEEPDDLFARGVQIHVDDGVRTEVLEKGNGLQRCIVFSLLQALIKNTRGELVAVGEPEPGEKREPHRPIILAIEEPELYIHPQLQRRIYRLLEEFADAPDSQDQVIYTTHSPAFVDVGNYTRIGLVRKDNPTVGSKVHQAVLDVLPDPATRKGFQFLASFGIEQNEMFFAKRLILVEGDHDDIAILAAGRELGLFKESPEERDVTVIVTGSKDEIPKFQRLLNTFRVPYTVLLEMDGQGETGKNAEIVGLLNGNRSARIPTNLETIVGHTDGHLSKKYFAKKWFEDPAHITAELKKVVTDLFDGLSGASV
jgi:hypothetical protein